MGEIWDDVLATQKEKDTLRNAINADKETCANEHQKRHPVECEECWPRIINRIRDRYLNSSTREWFSGRRLFLQELDTMFAEARERKRTIVEIDERIQTEKEEWCRDKLKTLGLASATDRPATINSVLNEKSKPFEELVSDLREILSKDPSDSQQAFKDFTEKLEAAKSPDAKIEVYVETFFPPQSDSEGALSCKKYIDMVRGGSSMSEAVTTMVRDRQFQGSKKEEKQFYLRQKDELTRAKAANDAAKAKKAKAKQDRARAAAAAAQEHDLPPCTNCGKKLDDQALRICDFCVALSEVYGFAERSPTYFCSESCFEAGIVCGHITF